jgi:hypothetical protein
MSQFQDEPVEEGAGEATDSERVDGVLEQVRADIALGQIDDPRAALVERLASAGISVDADELEGLVASL